MEIKKLVVHKAWSENAVVGHKCDLCGKEIIGDGWNPKDDSDISDTKVWMINGTEYLDPDTGYSEETIFDICPQCFKKKLVPWLKSQGAKPRKEKNEW